MFQHIYLDAVKESNLAQTQQNIMKYLYDRLPVVTVGTGAQSASTVHFEFCNR